MNERLASLVRLLKRPRILLAGDLILDKFVWGRVDRISPEAPIPVLKVEREEVRPGGAANVARNLAALEAHVMCLGVTGRDREGRDLARVLRQERVVPHLVVDPGRPTPLKTRMIAHHQQVLRVDSEVTTPLPARVERSLVALARKSARASDVVVVSDYHKGTLTPKVCRALLSSGRPVLVGLKGREAEKYRGATAASLNRSELSLLSGTGDLEAGAKKILKSLRLKFLVVTLGERGISVFPAGGAPIYRAAAAREVYDVTGAGDTALAAFAVGYASKLDLESCAELANAAGGIVVGKVATETVTRAELMGESGDLQKIVESAALRKTLEGERRRGKKVVFTNGCFDLLHAGHVQLLSFAKSKGDVLVVGLNSDSSVRRLKGPQRPLLPQTDRAALLAALADVDYVTYFDEETPEALIRTLVPDVLVKGQDYRKTDVVGARFVESRGGRVELAPLVPGLSTTDLVRRIQKRNP